MAQPPALKPLNKILKLYIAILVVIVAYYFHVLLPLIQEQNTLIFSNTRITQQSNSFWNITTSKN